MNVLAINKNKFQINELKEFFTRMNSVLFTAKTFREAIKKINNHQIDTVIIDINSISDIGMVKYLNDNFSNIKVFLTVENNFEDAISVFKEGNYSILHNPMKLQELKIIIEKNH